ncbi:MAG TPA: hypothetical protein VFS67_31470 [Polyangiaceae bacterium]|nr:hypothetical protein [Polyangiaceae bacterium]
MTVSFNDQLLERHAGSQVRGLADPDCSCASIAILDADHNGARLLQAHLSDRFPGAEIVATDLEQTGVSLPGDPHDVYVVRLSDCGAKELAFFVAKEGPAGDASVVFWGRHPQAPQVAAARALGIRRVVPAARLLGWLCEALPSLVSEARGRRLLRQAQSSLPAIPDWSDTPATERLCLMQAESMFRETYLRRLLAETGSCRRAAEIAGVPYRTFYDMVKKLDLR